VLQLLACRERRDVAVMLANTEVVLNTLSMLVGCILHVCAGFAYLAIFGVNVTHLVISLSSMTLAFAFVFGNSLRTIYESVVFLFVVRPYKVGDWIMYKKEFHRVTSFGLMWTQLNRFDGVRVSVRGSSITCRLCFVLSVAP
jgi:small-conductance mechanosensitive channel